MRARKGYTLVEVVVAMLLSAVMVSSVFSVALTSKVGGQKGDKKLAAGQVSQVVLAKLQNYVTADPGSQTIPGPGPAGNTWCIHNPPSITDSQGLVYALAPGSHTLTGPGIIPPALSGNVAGSVTYWVFWTNGTANCWTGTYPIAADCQPGVSVTVNWTTP